MKKQSILNLNEKSARKHINDIVQDFAKEHIQINLNKNLPIGVGLTFDKINTTPHSSIGIKDLTETHKLFKSQNPVNDDKFVEIIIALYHEHRHYELASNQYQINDTSSNIQNGLTIAYIAQQTNNNYYMTNRTNFITEIDAEFNGIMFAYKYILNNFPYVNQDEVEQLFINYVNNARTNTTYQITDTTTPIQSIQDIVDLFDTAYDEALTSRPRLYYRNRNNDDEVMNLLRKPEYDDIFTQICNEKNPYEKDKMIAALTLHLHPEYENLLPALEHIDLSATTLFHQNLPDDKTRIRTMLANQELNINDNCEKNINISPQIL